MGFQAVYAYSHKKGRRIVKLYGLKNCDNCKKALKAIKNAGKNIEFIDIKDNYISQCVKFDKHNNTVSFPKLNPKCRVMFDLLKKCRKNNKPVTFSGP